MHVLCLPLIASVVLALGSPAPEDDVAGDAAAHADEPPAELPPGVTEPLRAPVHSRPPASDVVRLPVDGFAPLTHRSPSGAPPPPNRAPAPLRVQVIPRPAAQPTAPRPIVAPLTRRSPTGAPVSPFPEDSAKTPPPAASAPPNIAAPYPPGPPLPPPARPDPRQRKIVRIELLVGPAWRIKLVESMVMVGLEAGRLVGFSGTFHAGMLVPFDQRNIIGIFDFPIGGGFVYRHRFGTGKRSLYGSVGASAGLLIHRAATDLGLIHRVDPDIQVPLRFMWTPGSVGLSVALLQGFSFRSRSYSRRGTEIWERIPYRIGVAVGLHFDIGVGRAKPRPSAPRRREKL